MISSCGKCGARSAMATARFSSVQGVVIAEPTGEGALARPSDIRQAGQSPSGASAASGDWQRGQVAVWLMETVSWNETLRHILLRKTRQRLQENSNFPAGRKAKRAARFRYPLPLPRFAQ